MKEYSKFRVRVLCLDGKEIFHEGLTWLQAKEKFRYYVDCHCEFDELSIRCVNIFKGKICVRIYSNNIRNLRS